MKSNLFRLILLIFVITASSSCKKDEYPEGFTWSPDPPAAGQEVTFRTSYHQTSYTCEWGFGDTQVMTTAYGETRHVYSVTGTYVVSLSVYDQNGVGQWSFSRNVTVQ